MKPRPMNQTRSFLLIAWLFAAGWLFIKWNEWNTAQNAPVAAATAVAQPASVATTPPPASLPGATAPAALPTAVATPSAAGTQALATPHLITLSNDELRLQIDLS